MLYFLVAFITFCVFKQWNPMFSPVIHSLDDSCPTRYGYHYTWTSTVYHTFPILDPTLDKNTLGSIWQFYYVATSHNIQNPNPGCITHKPSRTIHNPGHMTHNLGRMTQSKTYVLSIQHHNRLISETDVSSKCSKYDTVPIYVLLNYSNSQIDQKQHKIYKRSVLPLFLAIYRTIYYLLNDTFNQTHDVNHLINRLLLMLQRYITRCNDFKYLWFMLLLLGLLRSQHISLWFLTILYLWQKWMSGPG